MVCHMNKSLLSTSTSTSSLQLGERTTPTDRLARLVVVDYHLLTKVPTILKISNAPDFLYSSSLVLPNKVTYRNLHAVSNTNVETKDTIMKGVGGTAPFSKPRKPRAPAIDTPQAGNKDVGTWPAEAVAFLLKAPRNGLITNQLSKNGPAVPKISIIFNPVVLHGDEERRKKGDEDKKLVIWYIHVGKDLHAGACVLSIPSS